MRGGFRTRSDGQFVAQSQKAAQNEIPKQDITDTAASKGATAGQSSSAIPSISLPKGGGAIRGIGEKFAANPVTGTGSLNIPIITTPGRSGFGPQLSLSYDSGSGNGSFGFGWSLPIPSITRKTDKGLPKYQDANESDVFILSGAEDLVPVLVEGNNVQDRTVDGVQYKIKQYRPRIEGLFARIEQWTNTKSGETHWRSISKDNITTLYGKTDESRIFDSADPTHIFSWLICESYDDKGNAICYDYKAENLQGVDHSLVNEQNRTEATRSTNRYLKRIKYGNKTPHLPNEDLLQRSDWMFETVFDYGEHYSEDTQGQPTTVSINDDQRQWDMRQDPFSAYRAGFEVRTYRICQRVLMFHHFLDELGTDDYLVRSTAFTYSESPIASFVTGVTQSGYVLRDDGTYLKKSLPLLEFEYSQAAIQDEIKEIDAESLENLPIGLDGSLYQWVDLDGEGLSGILTEQADAWFYKPNLGGCDFGPLQVLAEKPSLADLSTGRQQLMDLAGDGQLDLVQLSGPVSGFYERTHDRHWEQFTPFTSLPNVDWSDPNLKFVDLTGDGHADILITEDQAFTWYLSLAEAGFSPNEKVYQALDEETGPRLVFADGTQSIYLADLSGDGLTDLARIRNGEVCYWPNLGYGRFGAKVTMDNAPWFDHTDQFNQQRIRLADIDGSGTTDIIYLESNGVHIYFNQSANAWSKRQTLAQFPHVDNLSSVMVADLMGNGTACLVWSSPLPGDAQQQMRYIDLMGGQKPHLLISSKNNMGAETRVHYVPSSKFYIEDREAGKPWITRIPFPVHVVEKVETYDRISQNRFVTRYAYHHGYFDGIEREFRGFGMVEQWDTEEFAAFGESNAFPAGNNIDEASHVPPVLTKTWFHTGSYVDGRRISRLFEDEYYRESDLSEGVLGLTDEQLGTMLLDDTVLPDTVRLADGTRVPFNLSAKEAREACRTLKGSILRQEIYALDGTDEEDRPYSVSERNYTIELLQQRGSNKHSVFFAHPRETIDFHYERKLYEIGDHKLGDPRVSHSMTLAVDEFGNVLQSVAIGYGRRYDDPDQVLTDDDRMKQKRTLVTYTENRFTNSINQDDAYRTPLPYETKTYEILEVIPDANEPLVTNLFRFKEMANKIHKASDGEHDISYEDIDAAGALEDVPYRRLIEHVRSLYRSNDLTGSLPLGKLEFLALPYENYKLAFTPGLFTQIYDGRVVEPVDVIMANEGRYVHSEGDEDWWIPSGQVFYSLNTNDSPAQELAFAQQHFFLPHRFRDPFDQETILTYDGYDLLMLESEDPLHNKVTAGERDAQGIITNTNNYRVLQPALITDPNGNRSGVAFDVLGMVAGTAMMGKPGENKGDSLTGFMPDLSEITILNHIQDPLADPHDILQRATTRLVYDLYPYYRTRNDAQPQPAVVYTLARETHDADLDTGQMTKIQHSFSYSDGFGREIQTKIQAEPGDVDGVPADPRWVGTGWTIFNNKGKPVRQYEPFFDNTHEFRFGKEVGVSPILFYDPVERVVATLHPNNTYEKVVFDPWHQKSYDVNDTVAFDPRTDPDISGYVGKYFEQIAPEPDTWETWLQQRGIDPLNPPEDIGLDPDKKAAVRTLVHADTPTTAFSDSLGRTFLTVAHNKFERSTNGDSTIIEEMYNTRIVFDIEGNQREVIDAKDRIVMRYDYDMLGSPIHQASMEAGERWMLNNVAGNPIRAWDSRGFQRRMTYDVLQRPVELFVTDTTGAEFLAEKSEYGESKPDPEITNHRMKPWKVYDGAGVVVSVRYDFKGNPLISMRQLLSDYRLQVDWAHDPQLEIETFTSRTTYDALNRPIQVIAPHSSRAGTKFNVTQPVYNEANLLERMDVWLEQDSEPESLLGPDTATQHFVTNINYNAKGQRELIEYGNGVRTTYNYDPLTFRLTNLRTMRGTEPLQDLFYTYDPAGNITVIRDDAQQTIYFNGQVVKPDADYKYDAIYRLIQSHGREHIGQASVPQTTWNDEFRVNLAHPNDGQAMRNYFEFYEYDEVGNILHFDHKAQNGNWIRAYDYTEKSLIETDKNNNRLSQTIVHPDGQQPIPEPYTHDSHGNMTSMPHLSQMEWDFEDQLHHVEKGNVMAYYVYDAAGERVRKVVEKNGGTLIEERIYLGGFEIFQKGNGSGIVLERETLHIMDDKQRIAMVETRTIDTLNIDQAPRQLVRYQFGNHLGSASLELDEAAQVISYEEYYPYGSTSYQAVRSKTEMSKRYRYTGKERDEETGLYYHGARYYAGWLGKWVSCDPLWINGQNLYIYVHSRPTTRYDPNGRNDKDAYELLESERKRGCEYFSIECLMPKISREEMDNRLREHKQMQNAEVIGVDYIGTQAGYERHLNRQTFFPTMEALTSSPLAAYVAWSTDDPRFIQLVAAAAALLPSPGKGIKPFSLGSKNRATKPPTPKHVGASPDTPPKQKVRATVNDAGMDKCVGNVCAIMKNQKLKAGPESGFTTSEIERIYKINFSRTKEGTPNPIVATPKRALRTIETITEFKVTNPKNPVDFAEAKAEGHYAIFLNESHVVYAKIGPGGRVSILDANVGRGWGNWADFLKYAERNQSLYGANPGKLNRAYHFKLE